MMRYWLQYSAKSTAIGPSAFSFIAHMVLIGAAVHGTAINARELAEAITQRIAYQPPPDRRGGIETVVEHLQFIDVGGGLPVPPASDGVLQVQGGPRQAPSAGGESSAERNTQEKSVEDPSRDSVYSVLEVEERAVRTANSAAPAYPPELM